MQALLVILVSWVLGRSKVCSIAKYNRRRLLIANSTLSGYLHENLCGSAFGLCEVVKSVYIFHSHKWSFVHIVDNVPAAPVTLLISFVC